MNSVTPPPSLEAACHVSPKIGLNGFFHVSKPLCAPATDHVTNSFMRSSGSRAAAAALR